MTVRDLFRSRGASWLARALTLGGLALLGWTSYIGVNAASFRRDGLDAARHWSMEPAESAGLPARATADPAALLKAPAPSDPVLKAGTRIGVLEIPRLKYSEVVAEGDSPVTLKKAIGHLPDSPLPWQGGNAVLAGHRDTHFRALKQIAIGDRLRLRTERGVFEYQVDDKMIVTPNDLSVLGGKDGRLTLVTCYPFTYIGSAPQRFIVTAIKTTSAQRSE
jgi:sortase A